MGPKNCVYKTFLGDSCGQYSLQTISISFALGPPGSTGSHGSRGQIDLYDLSGKPIESATALEVKKGI